MSTILTTRSNSFNWTAFPNYSLPAGGAGAGAGFTRLASLCLQRTLSLLTTDSEEKVERPPDSNAGEEEAIFDSECLRETARSETANECED